ncbi:MAG: hypothetical protein AAFY83_12165 [Pseudomonadota bacterium]
MYLRFVTPHRAYGAVCGHMRAEGRHVAAGLFQPAGAIARDGRQPVWLRRALREQFDWFNTHMPVPNRKGVVTRRSYRPYTGVCWFRTDNTGGNTCDAIARAAIIAALLGEAGVPVVRRHTRTPGEIVYRDDFQIVAVPCGDADLRWH